jgi:hypothetical protein
MFRPIFALTLVVAFVCACAVAALRSRAYTPDALIDWFAAESGGDCVLPCWEGIRPGFTTGSDALLRLYDMPDVYDIVDVETSHSLEGAARFIRWRWHFPLAAPLEPTGLLIVEDDIVQEVFLTTPILLGDVWLTYGRPDGGTVAFTENLRRDGLLLSTGVYAARGLSAMSYIDCPMRLSRLWTSAVYVWLRKPHDTRFAYSSYPTYIHELIRGFRDGDQDYC